MISEIVSDLAEAFPLMRGGGAFLASVGLGLVVGAFGVRTWRLAWLIAGAGLGVALMAVGGATKLIFDGLGYPHLYQWVALAAGVLLEGYLVSVVVRRYPDLRAREFWLWMLFVVGVHFLVLGISHGPVCALLGLVCMANAWLGLRLPGADFRLFWAVDGLLKIAAGAGMVALSY